MTFELHADEGLHSLIVRLSSFKKLKNPSQLISDIVGKKLINSIDCFFEIRRNKEFVIQISQKFRLNYDLINFLYGGTDPQNDYILEEFSGELIHCDAYHTDCLPVCLDCLSQYGFLPRFTDYRSSLICPLHHKPLIHQCFKCRYDFNFRTMGSLLYCGKCGVKLTGKQADFHQKDVDLLQSTTLVTAAEDFSSLARFRFSSEKSTFTVAWNGAFNLLRLQSLSVGDVFKIKRPHGKTPKKYDGWFSAINSFSKMLEESTHTYELERFSVDYVSHPLFSFFPKQYFLRQSIHSYAIETLQVDSSLANAALLPNFRSRKLRAYEVYRDNIPYINTLDGLARFFGLNADALKSMDKFERYPRKNTIDDFYDIDDLLSYQRYIDDNWLSISEFREFTGLSDVSSTELKSANLSVINFGLSDESAHVAVEDVLLLHIRLAMAYDYANAVFPDFNISSGQVAVSSLSECIRIARGDLKIFCWTNSYKWTSIFISSDENT